MRARVLIFAVAAIIAPIGARAAVDHVGEPPGAVDRRRGGIADVDDVHQVTAVIMHEPIILMDARDGGEKRAVALQRQGAAQDRVGRVADIDAEDVGARPRFRAEPLRRPLPEAFPRLVREERAEAVEGQVLLHDLELLLEGLAARPSGLLGPVRLLEEG
jgi:hypothetical protein